MNPRLLAVSLIALASHTAAPAKTVKLTPAAAGLAQPNDTAPQAKISYGDLDLRHAPGAQALRLRMDHAVIELSGGYTARSRPDVMVARARAQAQADAIIAAAQA